MSGSDSSHPSAELLGAFIEGRLGRSATREIASHVETCKECLMVAGETVRLEREIEETEEDADAAENGDPPSRRWWPLALAAGLAGIVLISLFAALRKQTDPLHRLVRASAKLASRRTEGRLTQFPYVPQAPSRGENGDDRGAAVLRGTAEEIAARKASPSTPPNSTSRAWLRCSSASTIRPSFTFSTPRPWPRPTPPTGTTWPWHCTSGPAEPAT